jgi:Domain of unknown function (DUF4259)
MALTSPRHQVAQVRARRAEECPGAGTSQVVACTYASRMGAWGTGIYDNDSAADWTWGLASGGLAAVEAALRAAAEADYIDADDGACALAAADVVARLVAGGGETSGYCEDVVAWVAANPTAPERALVVLASHAVQRVRGDDSEQVELWAENSESFPEWLSVLDELAARLASAND